MLNYRYFTSLIITSAWVVSGLGQVPQPLPSANSIGSRVKVETVTKIFTGKDTPAYLVGFSYDFGNARQIHIEGLGVVAGKGNFQYITTNQELEFRDASNDALLERVPLREKTVIAARPPLNEIPPEDQFSAYRSFIWEQGVPLQERANAVLGRYFNYRTYEKDKLTHLATTYTQLPLSKKLTDNGIQAQIALLLSFPYDPATGKYSFRVQPLAKEGRLLSDDLRSTSNAEIVEAGNAFVDKIVKEMKSGR